MTLLKSFTLICSVSIVLLLTGCQQYDTTPYIDNSARTPSYEPYTPPVVYPAPTPKPVENINVNTDSSLEGVTILVDAGHGGKDPGAGEVGFSKVPEKIINLAISKEVERLLRARGAKVLMVRKDDSTIDIDFRATIPDRINTKIDLMVSIHADSHPDKYISGATVYTAKECSYKSTKAAQSILKSFEKSKIKTRGLRQRDLKVLVKHSRPAVLVECGYLTNAYEAADLNNKWYQKKIARTIANGIANSF